MLRVRVLDLPLDESSPRWGWLLLGSSGGVGCGGSRFESVAAESGNVDSGRFALHEARHR